MIIIPLLQKLVPFASDLYKELTAPKSEAAQCRDYFGKVLSFMRRKAGHLIDLETLQYSDKKSVASDIHVNIIYRVEARPDVMVPQQFSYAVDTSSWKNLAKDLFVLGKQFREAAEKSYGPDHPDIVNFMDEYNLYLKAVKHYAQKADINRHPS